MLTPPANRILQSPVLHFLLAGGVLFGLAALFGIDRSGASRIPVDTRSFATSEATSDGKDGPGTIRVERAELIAFIQSRTRMALAADAEQAFDSATEAVRRDWIDRYVREEALVREARSLGLDRNDELIRRRLVQQMEFLVEGIGESAFVVSDAEIAAAYRQRSAELREPVTLRFAHVFVREDFREEKGRAAEAEIRARSLLERLNRERIGFDGALALGDRFLYDRSYVDRTLDEVRSHFGDSMAEALAEVAVDPVAWSGPYRSEHGLHLVLLTGRSASRLPALDEVEGRLRETLLREKREGVLERGIEGIVARYPVELDGSLRDGGAAEPRP